MFQIQRENHMFEMYQKSKLELEVEEKFKENYLLTPADLDFENVIETFDIKVKFHNGPDRALWDDDLGVYMIFMKPYYSQKEKRGILFHELCHILRHYGSQELMNCDSWKDLQEEDASHFQLYASMPFFMIENLQDLPRSESELIEKLSVVFNVPITLATKRVKQIKRRIGQAQLEKQFMELVNNEKVFNYCKNIEPRKFSKSAEDMMALAIQMKLSKKGVTVK